MDFDAIPQPSDSVIAWPGHTFSETHGPATIPEINTWPFWHPAAAEHSVAVLHAAGDVMLPSYSGFNGGLAELHEVMKTDPSEAVIAACYAVVAIVRRVPEVEAIARREWFGPATQTMLPCLSELAALRDVMTAAIDMNAGAGVVPALRLMSDWDPWFLLQCALLLIIWMAWFRTHHNGIPLDTVLKMFFNAVVYYIPAPADAKHCS
jgi:hypothetical protein